MRLETHGRWPLVAAAAVAPVTAAAIRRPELRPLAALLLHQTEEWVWPGGFLPWMNREVLGSGEDEFPLDPRMGLVINVGFGWGTSLGTILPSARGRGRYELMMEMLRHGTKAGLTRAVS